MKTTKMSKANSGIKCEVDSCYFYMSGDQCTAERIQIAPKNAKTNNETDCLTFTLEGQR